MKCAHCNKVIKETEKYTVVHDDCEIEANRYLGGGWDD